MKPAIKSLAAYCQNGQRQLQHSVFQASLSGRRHCAGAALQAEQANVALTRANASSPPSLRLQEPAEHRPPPSIPSPSRRHAHTLRHVRRSARRLRPPQRHGKCIQDTCYYGQRQKTCPSCFAAKGHNQQKEVIEDRYKYACGRRR
jgi:hypothetical protein